MQKWLNQVNDVITWGFKRDFYKILEMLRVSEFMILLLKIALSDNNIALIHNDNYDVGVESTISNNCNFLVKSNLVSILLQ